LLFFVVFLLLFFLSFSQATFDNKGINIKHFGTYD
jgi:hypothetical protein